MDLGMIESAYPGITDQKMRDLCDGTPNGGHTYECLQWIIDEA